MITVQCINRKDKRYKSIDLIKRYLKLQNKISIIFDATIGLVQSIFDILQNSL